LTALDTKEGRALRYPALARPPKATKSNAAKKAKPQASPAPRHQNSRQQQSTSILPMQLRAGDRFTDETGEWEIVSHPASAVGGKIVRVRVRKLGEPPVSEERVWSAYEKVAVKRAGDDR
jgi:hypothetical protein